MNYSNLRAALMATFMMTAVTPQRLLAASWPVDEKSMEILLSATPSRTEEFAAGELQAYLQKMSGKLVPIRQGSEREEGKHPIIVGRHPLNADLWKNLDNPDRYIIEADDAQIRVVGGYRPPLTDAKGRIWLYEWGILNGVYELLEEQGIRWFRPEPMGEHVPKAQSFAVKNGKRMSEPAFAVRWGIAPYATFSFRSTTPEERNWATLWSLRNGANINRSSENPAYGGSWQVTGGHSYQYHVPASLFKTHPEYFSLINGERVPDKQICHSNPQLQDHVVATLDRLICENPQYKLISIDPNDHGGWCECANCRAWDDINLPSARGGGRISMSNRVFHFNKIIAERIGKMHPEVTLYCLAYNQYTEAPTLTGELPSNLWVGVAPFDGAYSDWSHGLRDPESRQNSRLMKNIDGFRKLGVKMHAREYFSFYDYHGWPGPLPMLRMIQDRLRVFREEGFQGVCSETHPCWGPQGMELFMALRLMRNPDLDLEKEVADYCVAFYGPAAEAMQQYHGLIEKRGRSGIYYGSGGRLAENLFTNEFLDQLKPWVEKAEGLVKGKQPYEWRTESVLAGYRLARLYRSTRDAIESGNLEHAAVLLNQLEFLLCDQYPNGDVFVKGLGRNKKDAKGNYVPATLVSDLAALLTRAQAVENRFEGARVAQVLNNGWLFKTDAENRGLTEEWQKESPAREGWSKISAGLPWQQQGFTNYQGVAWYQREFTGPAVEERLRVLLVFGAVDGDANVWINGEPLGSHNLVDEEGNLQWDEPFHFDITDKVKAGMVNTVTVRVAKDTGAAGLHREVKLLKVPRY